LDRSSRESTISATYKPIDSGDSIDFGVYL